MLFTGLDEVLSQLERVEQRPTVLFLDWVTQATQAAMRVTCVSPGEECGPKGLTKWRKRGDQWCWSVFYDWAHRCCDKAQPILLPYLSQRCLCPDSWSPRNLATFPGQQAFSTDQRRRLETPSWEVLDYEGIVMSPAEVERQQERILRAPLANRDREYLFSEDIIVDETGAADANLGFKAKISSLIEVLPLSGSYELVYQLWAQFTPSTVPVNVIVTWSCDEVFVSISICTVLST